MRSNKEPWLRGGAVFAWTVVLACAAHTLAHFTRKDPNDHTPVERIAAFTPDRIEWDFVLCGGDEIFRVSGPTDSFRLILPSAAPGQRPCVVEMGRQPQLKLVEIFRGSEIEQAILACLDRAIRSGELDDRSGVRMVQLRDRLAQWSPDRARSPNLR